MRRILLYMVIGFVVGAAGLGGAFLLYDNAVTNATFTATQADDSVDGRLYYYENLRDDRQEFVDATLNQSVTTTPTDVTITGNVVKDGTVYVIERQANWLAFTAFSISGGIGVLATTFGISSAVLALVDWRYDAILDS